MPICRWWRVRSARCRRSASVAVRLARAGGARCVPGSGEVEREREREAEGGERGGLSLGVGSWQGLCAGRRRRGFLTVLLVVVVVLGSVRLVATVLLVLALLVDADLLEWSTPPPAVSMAVDELVVADESERRRSVGAAGSLPLCSAMYSRYSAFCLGLVRREGILVGVVGDKGRYVNVVLRGGGLLISDPV